MAPVVASPDKDARYGSLRAQTRYSTVKLLWKELRAVTALRHLPSHECYGHLSRMLWTEYSWLSIVMEGLLCCFGKDYLMRLLPLLSMLLLILLAGCGRAESSYQTVSQADLIGQTVATGQEIHESRPSASALVPTSSSTDGATVTPVPVASRAIQPTAPIVQPPTPTQVPMTEGNPDSGQQMIADRAQLVVETLKERDVQTLAELIHPQKGVRFSPYSTVNEQQLVFSAEQVARMDTDTTIYTWGAYEGIGFPIELTFADYFNRFVYSHDFAQAERVGYNESVGKGTAVHNSWNFYGSNVIVVEYHFPGFDPKYEGMDWVSLGLVFEEVDQQWYVSGIIHDQWTI